MSNRLEMGKDRDLRDLLVRSSSLLLRGGRGAEQFIAVRPRLCLHIACRLKQSGAEVLSEACEGFIEVIDLAAQSWRATVLGNEGERLHLSVRLYQE